MAGILAGAIAPGPTQPWPSPSRSRTKPRAGDVRDQIDFRVTRWAARRQPRQPFRAGDRAARRPMGRIN